MGLAVWTTDQAGPFQTKPYLGHSWQPTGQPQRQAHEYIRDGTAKLLTLFHAADGQVRAKGVTSCPNTVLHPWLKQELIEILASLPQPVEVPEPSENRTRWERWFEGLSNRPESPTDLPPLRLLLVIDNLAHHKSDSLVQWFFSQGIIPLYTPLGDSWLNTQYYVWLSRSSASWSDGRWTANIRPHRLRSLIGSKLPPGAGIVRPPRLSGVVNGPPAGHVAANGDKLCWLWVALALAFADLSADTKLSWKNGDLHAK